MISRLKLNYFNTPATTDIANENKTASAVDKSVTETLTDSKKLQRQVTIEPEPDSLDSVLLNPQSYPITIVPNRPNTFYGLTTQNGKPFTRQQSCR